MFWSYQNFFGTCFVMSDRASNAGCYADHSILVKNKILCQKSTLCFQWYWYLPCFSSETYIKILFSIIPLWHISLQQSYERNSRGLEIFTKCWFPENRLMKAIVCLCHGYGDTCTFFLDGRFCVVILLIMGLIWSDTSLLAIVTAVSFSFRDC